MLTDVRGVMLYGFFMNEQPREFFSTEVLSAFELSRQIEMVYYGIISINGIADAEKAAKC